jgi:pyruvate/2-oxoglutarate dehydrogenase complex dihydrolipoamide acyltransferase (E2) component
VAKTIDIVVPDLGDFEKVEVIEVLVGAGDTVEREDGLVTIETDKASLDIPSPENGVIEKLTINVGDTVSTGDVIGQLTMEVGDTVVIAPSIASKPTGDTTVVATAASTAHQGWRYGRSRGLACHAGDRQGRDGRACRGCRFNPVRACQSR